jgi:hypothetical protein
MSVTHVPSGLQIWLASQQRVQPHRVCDGEQSGTHEPLTQKVPQPQGGAQTSGTQTWFTQCSPGSMQGPSQMPPQPSPAPQ